MVLLLVRRGLLVHEDRVGTVRELRVGDVEPGVDDGHGLARPGRVDDVGADDGAPPLGRDERIGRDSGCRGVEQHVVRLAELDDTRRAQSFETRRGHAPDPQLADELRPAGPAGQGGAAVRLELHEVGAGGAGTREDHRRHDQKAPGQGLRVLGRQ